jgi:hypothetical protein
LETNLGIQVRKWVETLISIWALEGRTRGPAFFDRKGDMSRSQDYDQMFPEMLERIQERRPELFLPGENLADTHGISRWLRKGSMLEAQAAGVIEAEINRMNPWRTVERAMGRQPKFHMMEHYTLVRIAIKTLVRYPTAL